MNLKPQSFISLIGILLISSLSAIAQINADFRENQKKAFIASSISECESSLKFCNEVLKIAPNHPILNYQAARLNALLGNKNLAIKQLRKATKLGYTTKLPFHKIHHLNDAAFDNLRDKEEFKSVIKILEKHEKPIHKSEVAFTLSDKDLMPEGIDYDPLEKMFYFGSETKNKIVKVDHFGNSIDFTQENQDGLGSLRGIHIDPIRRTLWVCSESKKTSEIFKYKLSTGKLIKKYLAPRNNASYNDLVIHQNGDVYIPDGRSGEIYLISQASDELEVFFKSDLVVSYNGVTLSDDGRVIYVADPPMGIYKIDIETKAISMLAHGADFSTFGIDGLYFLNNNLYAVQTGLNIISKFSLNKDATYIKSCEIYERNTAYLDWPTTGVIADDYFYFIADTQGKGNKLEGIIIMKAPLK